MDKKFVKITQSLSSGFMLTNIIILPFALAFTFACSVMAFFVGDILGSNSISDSAFYYMGYMVSPKLSLFGVICFVLMLVAFLFNVCALVFCMIVQRKYILNAFTLAVTIISFGLLCGCLFPVLPNNVDILIDILTNHGAYSCGIYSISKISESYSGGGSYTHTYSTLSALGYANFIFLIIFLVLTCVSRSYLKKHMNNEVYTSHVVLNHTKNVQHVEHVENKAVESDKENKNKHLEDDEERKIEKLKK
jgi:hypothetical protein